MKGRMEREYEKNRVGMCVLLPLQGVEAMPCHVRSSQGPIQAHFPDLVSQRKDKEKRKKKEKRDRKKEKEEKERENENKK